MSKIIYTDTLAGLGKDIWKKLGGGDRYIEKERSTWINNF